MIRGIFKSLKIKRRSLYLHPIASLIMWDMWLYCYERNLEFVVTDTVTKESEDRYIGRKSDTHRTSRAFDLRNRSWSEDDIASFIEFFTKKYGRFGALDRHGNRHLIVAIEHGTGPHFHVQVDRIYSIENKNLD